MLRRFEFELSSVGRPGGKGNKMKTSLDEPPDGGVAGEESQGALGAPLWCGETTATLEEDEGVETSPPTDH